MRERSGPGVMEWLGVGYKTIRAAAQTGGAMSIVGSLSPPGSGPLRHVHAREDETPILVSGAVWLEGQVFAKGLGEGAFIQTRQEHTARVIGTEPSRHLLLLTPRGFEGLFANMAGGQFRIPGDRGRSGGSAARHGLRFTGPPLGAT